MSGCSAPEDSETTASDTTPSVEATTAPVTESEAETPEPSPEPTFDESFGPHPLPTLPPETLVGDEEGAVAYVGYFLALMDYAATTGDLSEWNENTFETCYFCDLTRTQIEGVWDSGYAHFQTPTLSEVISIERITDDGVYNVTADVTFGESFDLGPEGDVVNEADASERRTSFLVEQLEDSSWILYEAGRAS